MLSSQWLAFLTVHQLQSGKATHTFSEGVHNSGHLLVEVSMVYAGHAFPSQSVKDGPAHAHAGDTS